MFSNKNSSSNNYPSQLINNNTNYVHGPSLGFWVRAGSRRFATYFSFGTKWGSISVATSELIPRRWRSSFPPLCQKHFREIGRERDVCVCARVSKWSRGRTGSLCWILIHWTKDTSRDSIPAYRRRPDVVGKHTTAFNRFQIQRNSLVNTQTHVEYPIDPSCENDACTRTTRLVSPLETGDQVRPNVTERIRAATDKGERRHTTAISCRVMHLLLRAADDDSERVKLRRVVRSRDDASDGELASQLRSFIPLFVEDRDTRNK